jgi:glycine/D-amino acid oxidase-like deaminating enzyme
VYAETQVVVIGAGVIGCSIAYHLARRGAAVTVVDANGVATGTSSATLGLVWVQRKEPAEYMELNYLSSRLHQELAKAFDDDVELNQPGGIATYFDQPTFDKQLAVMEHLNAASAIHQARMLTAAEARQMEPELSPYILGAIYCPHDGEINPMRLAVNLARNAKKCGAHFITHAGPVQIKTGEIGVLGVETPEGLVRTGVVVVAAGMGTSALVRPLGIDLPVVFEKGQLLVTEAMRRIMTYPTGNTRQTAHGNILLGTTYEADQSERVTTIEGARKVADDVIRRYPILKDARVIRHFAGIRPLPQDGKPYLGAVKRVPGLYVATSPSGITLSPVHGKVISELILDGKTDVPIRAYSPERYCSGYRPEP